MPPVLPDSIGGGTFRRVLGEKTCAANPGGGLPGNQLDDRRLLRQISEHMDGHESVGSALEVVAPYRWTIQCLPPQLLTSRSHCRNTGTQGHSRTIGR